MKYILFIVGMVLWVGISSRKYMRKQVSDLEDDSYQPQKPSRPAFESLFVDEAKTETSFAEEEAAAGYFTYESEPAAPQSASAAAPTAVSSFARGTMQVDREPAGADFDLRQAIIYHTILTAKYVPEVNLHEIN
ncbi:MAG: hypothetical protein IJ785_00180 [Bacteroidales bacterium]|nr:hypothetical protein [Bacteroidales bacterium]